MAEKQTETPDPQAAQLLPFMNMYDSLRALSMSQDQSQIAVVTASSVVRTAPGPDIRPPQAPPKTQ